MAASKKRSISDMQHLDASSLKQDDDETYRLMVLRFHQTEDEVDRNFLQTALDLGINIPQEPKTTLDLITSNVATLDLNPTLPEPHQLSPSPASESAHTASDSSIEQMRNGKTPSLTATSITSASMSSASSYKSNYGKVRKGFRRISRLHRRKTMAVPVPVPAVPLRTSSMLHLSRPGLEPRAITADQISTICDSQPHAITTNQIQTLSIPRKQVSSAAHNAPPPSTPPVPLSPPLRSPEEETMETLSARRRSISNPALKKLRTTQLQEQLRFISFEASQHRLMRTKQLQHKRDALSQYQEQERDTHSRHTDALSSLETRHLTAEVDLQRTLQLERQACDTRLKHMQAYCNPRSTVAGMPSRVVTKSDYRQLEQQYHIRNGMDNLNASRINVLREKQGKQQERIVAKQETELEALESSFERQNEELEAKFREEEIQLQQEFAERKKRLVRRWTLAEAIERRKLEQAMGETFEPLPSITWSSDEGGRGKEKERALEGPGKDMNLAYDAMNMI
ncbi:MAG: hypothetical protein ALECFALPRED_007969 [Alectoria fallacina]|uniref:Uncharacterized protein n=1 Tax=Alectoria fallacina TaxID=1903189 RepID=A0A8H3J1W8_9LECA|nr:MAG: hypothetical protein ALECFALPRED_007969 [Alectoria fallacina]